ncbi:MAG: hypothetical protein II754_03110, partial [Lachnospiraceae bacterium]|nr:hypothetical protein [Lachnospiraceae bacterium]
HMEDSYYRHAEALDEEFAELGKEEEGGKELLKAYEEFKTVQLRDMQLRLDGKEVDEDTRKLRKEKENRLIECWKRVSLARLKKHYRDAFETPETIYSPLTNYMKVTGDVIKRNKWKTVSTLGSVSGKLVMRLKDIGG